MNIEMEKIYQVFQPNNNFFKTIDFKILKPGNPYSISKSINLLNKKIEKIISYELPIYKKIYHFVVDSKAKHVRPLLHYYCARMMGYQGKNWLDVGAIAELIHSASLLHDDVVDEGKTRRNSLSINERYGNKVAILCGDHLLACALSHLNSLSICASLLPLFTNVIHQLVESELLQMQYEKSDKITHEIYKKIVQGKTAVLFGCMTQSAYILLCLEQKIEQDKKIQKSYKEFGERLGHLFQLRDDYLDYFDVISKNNKKEPFQDLKRGLITAPIFHLYKKVNSKEKEEVAKILNTKYDSNKNQQVLQKNIMKIQKLFVKYQIQEQIDKEMFTEIRYLSAFINRHPESKFKDQLLEQISILIKDVVLISDI